MKKTKKEKINPIMENNKKIKNIKLGNTSSDDENILKKFIITTIIIVILIGVIYGFTELFNKNKEVEETKKSANINYDKVSVGTILNRPYDEYYVLAYSKEDKDAVVYSAILDKYMYKKEEKDYVKIYYCDLGNKLNKEYYNKNNDNISNKDAKKTEDFDFGDLTLLKIENNKITKYIEDVNQIKELLK